MNLQEALTKPDKTKLTSVTLKTFKNYGAKQVGSNGSYLSSVMLDTPQGSPKTYLKVWSKTAQIPVQDSTEYTIQAKITPQGAQGITINEYNGKKSIDIDIDTVNLLPAGASPAAEVMAHAQQPVQEVAQPAVVSQPAAQPVATQGGKADVNLTRAELLKEFASVYAEAAQLVSPTMEATFPGGQGAEKAHEFALQAVASLPTYWFGEKTCR